MGDIQKQRFVCIDCETTGLDPKQDQILEIALLCFDMQQDYEQMESLVDPCCVIPETSIAIHNITPEMVKGKPKIAELLPDFLKMVGDRILVGHGIGFDIAMVAAAAERASIPCSLQFNRYLDTLRMARLYGESPVNSLESLRKHFNIPLEGAHRAMNDVVVNRAVFRHLAKSYKTTEHLFETLAKPILMTNIPLGKHKGRPFKEIPIQYLQWMSHQNFDQDLLFSIRTELKRRKKGGLFQQAGNPFLDL